MLAIDDLKLPRGRTHKLVAALEKGRLQVHQHGFRDPSGGAEGVLGYRNRDGRAGSRIGYGHVADGFGLTTIAAVAVFETPVAFESVN